MSGGFPISPRSPSGAGARPWRSAESPTLTGNSAWGGEWRSTSRRATCPSTSPIRWRPGCLRATRTRCGCPPSPSRQAALVCAALEELLAGAFSDLRPYAACLRYPRESGLTEALSALCDARIIWGGDETVRRVRAFPLKPRAAEICFADRWSACVIDSGAYLAHADRDALARDFYNDTYLNDQRSCAAPRAVLWLGEREGEARADFWPRVEAIAATEYDWPPRSPSRSGRRSAASRRTAPARGCSRGGTCLCGWSCPRSRPPRWNSIRAAASSSRRRRLPLARSFPSAAKSARRSPTTV